MSNTRQVNFDNQVSQMLKICPLNIILLSKNYKCYNIKNYFFSIASNQKDMLKVELVLEKTKIMI